MLNLVRRRLAVTAYLRSAQFIEDVKLCRQEAFAQPFSEPAEIAAIHSRSSYMSWRRRLAWQETAAQLRAELHPKAPPLPRPGVPATPSWLVYSASGSAVLVAAAAAIMALRALSRA